MTFAMMLCFLLATSISSCSPVVNKSPATFVTNATLQAYPTPVSILDYSDQVTDRKLLLSIKEVEKTCYKADNLIKIEIVFENISNEPINIPETLSIAQNRRGDGGNLIPLITTLGGEVVKNLGDFQLVDIFNTPVNTYQKIADGQSINSVVKFRFPKYFADIASEGALVLSTPRPEQYFLRFVFVNYSSDQSIWSGSIGSNRIRICVTD